MPDWLSTFFSWLESGLSSVLDLLPDSPFSDLSSQVSSLPYIGWLNWFVPVGAILSTFTVWVSAILLLYVGSIVLRWVKVLGD